MTLLCITSQHLPGIRPCAIYGEHKITCPDREINRAIAEHEGAEVDHPRCRGCLPREAEHGLLCGVCYESLTAAYAGWDHFVRLVNEAGMRTHAAESSGGGSAAVGFANLPLTYIELDACSSFLASFPGRLDQWVATEAGARDAVQFAKAAHSAYRTLEVEEREQRIHRVRCPECDQLTLTRNPTREVGGMTVVECQHCGHVLDKMRMPVDRWVGSRPCEHDDHLACDRLACACPCHLINHDRDVGGIRALFEADLATSGWTAAARATWVVLPDGRFTQIQKEQAA